MGQDELTAEQGQELKYMLTVVTELKHRGPSGVSACWPLDTHMSICWEAGGRHHHVDLGVLLFMGLGENVAALINWGYLIISQH